jgi:Response regulator containing CheY-like receiver, AAA-type ATPase, and DNA-binding domains
MELRAIVLDDEYAMRTLIGEILEERGYDVHVSSEPFSSPIFLESKCDCPVDTPCANILITDINMPNMTGLEFIKHQKKKGCKIQNIAVMSAGWTAEDVEHAKRLGCHTFKKPFDFDEIDKWLDSCERKSGPNDKLSDLRVPVNKC